MTRMRERLIVAGAGALFVGGTLLGGNMLLASPPPPPEVPVCENRTLAAGENLSSNLLLVNVYNDGQKAGLANRVTINLERQGFLGGVISNNPGEVKASNVTILTDDPKAPHVALLAAQFKGKIAYAEPDFATEPGLSLIVGSSYKGLKKDPKTSVELSEPLQVCVPPIELS